MSRITLDELHMTFRVPAGLSDAVTTDMVRTLSRRSLQRRLAKLVTRFLTAPSHLESGDRVRTVTSSGSTGPSAE